MTATRPIIMHQQLKMPTRNQRSDHVVHTGCPKPACVCPGALTWHSNRVQESGGGGRGIGLSSVRLQQGIKRENRGRVTRGLRSSRELTAPQASVVQGSGKVWFAYVGLWLSLIPPFGREMS